MKEINWDFVRVRVTSDFLKLVFNKGVKYYEVIEGIDEEYKFKCMIQDNKDSLYYLLFFKGNVPEGSVARDFDIIIKRKDLIDKEELKEKISRIFDKESIGYKVSDNEPLDIIKLNSPCFKEVKNKILKLLEKE